MTAQGCGLRLSFCLQVQCTTTLQVGSIQAGSPSESGQCFSLSWMPSKPHHHLAAGFYDGEFPSCSGWAVSHGRAFKAQLLPCSRQSRSKLRAPAPHCLRTPLWCCASSALCPVAPLCWGRSGAAVLCAPCRHRGHLEPAHQVPAAACVPARWLPQALPFPELPSPRPCCAEHRVVQSQQVRAGKLLLGASAS